MSTATNRPTPANSVSAITGIVKRMRYCGASGCSEMPREPMPDQREANGGHSGSARSALLLSAGLTLLIVLPNALQPLVIDDAAYLRYAEQVLAHPFDPYGFEFTSGLGPVPAIDVHTPPVLPYWLAAVRALVGENPVLWKIGMLPFAALLCLALAWLARRFAPDASGTVMGLALLSPAVWPALHLMLDLPALALSLAALCCMIRASDAERGFGLALAAGAIAGLALLTKYTAAVPLLAMLGYALLARRTAHALLAGLASSVVFGAFEAWTWSLYGTTVLQRALVQVSDLPTGGFQQDLVAFFGLLAVSSPALGLLALHARGAAGSTLASLGAIPLFLIAYVALLPAAAVPEFPDLYPVNGRFGTEGFGWSIAGLSVAGCVVAGIATPFARDRPRLDAAWLREHRSALFLGLWVALEGLGWIFISPYPALRRMIGLHVALALALGHTLARVDALRETRRVRAGIVAYGVLLGLFFVVTDWSDAKTRERGFDQALSLLESQPEADRGTRWFTGQWGFRYLALRNGLTPWVQGRSQLAAGDWVLLPTGVWREPFVRPRDARSVALVRATNPWPWSTIPSAYASWKPLRRQPTAQLTVRLLRFEPGPQRGR